jgi:nitrous oxidase accessory protein NosD
VTARHILTSLLVGSALTVGLAAPASAGGGCQVRNTTQGTPVGSDLAAAIVAADPGDQLRLKATCVGNFSIDKDLTIVGRGRPSIDGGGTGTTLSVEQPATVRLDRLLITGGGRSGLFVAEGATVAAARTTFYGNTSSAVGGGITVGGDLQLRGSSVLGNHAEIDGGGIYSYGDVKLVRSYLYQNTADGGGGGLFNEGVAELRRSGVTYNVASSGGGILNVDLITLVHTKVRHNLPNDCEGC